LKYTYILQKTLMPACHLHDVY